MGNVRAGESLACAIPGPHEDDEEEEEKKITAMYTQQAGTRTVSARPDIGHTPLVNDELYYHSQL